MRSEAIFFGSLTRLFLLKDVNGQRAIFPVVWPKAPTVGAAGSLQSAVKTLVVLKFCFNPKNAITAGTGEKKLYNVAISIRMI